MYDFLLLASCLVFIGTCIAYARHDAASLFHPATIYLAFHGFIFVIRPLFARFYEFDLVYRVYDFLPSLSDKITVILGSNLAMLVFVFTALRVGGQPVARSPDALEFDRLRRDFTGPILLTCVLLAPLALAAQFATWERRVDPYLTMARDAGTGIMVNVEANGWFMESALILAPLSVFAVWLLRYRPLGWLIFAIASVLMLGSGGRGAFVFAATAIAIIFLLERGRRWFDPRVAGLGILAVLVFNAVVIDRGQSLRSMLGSDLDGGYTTAHDLDPLEHMDFANLEYFEYIVYAVPQRTGSWDYFAHNLQIFTEPVPRSLWPDKPIGSPVKFFELWDYGTPIGMTISLPGAGWMSFGYVGIAIYAALFAWLYGAIYARLLGRSATPVAMLAYALLAATTIVVFRDGILLTLLRQLPFYFGPFLLVLLFARVKKPNTPRTIAPYDSAGETPADRRRALASQGSRQLL
ncbi:O-antigen ligase [Qipengyuania sp. XHP0211]|uniref:O-antigen polymerase n=1 Tax=Qipengyuania sp. XHP0211 TaxID=3038079 RepID=UPI00241BF374|nr:O-antigen polymerase [Qipengyuania sp. XHP0211]MDG5750159.1 O-antigen ligase [Qipengyuania sp. XHP0211]